MSEEQKEKQHEHILSMQMIMEECAIDINKKIEHLHNGSKYAINNFKL